MVHTHIHVHCMFHSFIVQLFFALKSKRVSILALPICMSIVAFTQRHTTVHTCTCILLFQPYSFCPSLQIMSEVMRLSQNVAVSLPLPSIHIPHSKVTCEGFVSHAETVCVDRCIQSSFSLLTRVEFCT